MSKIIAVSNQKGGVGKTSTAVNLAAAMGIFGKKTLIIDLDPQANTTSGLGFDKREIKKSTYDVLSEEKTAEEVIQNTEFKNLDLMPGSINMAAADAGISLFSGKESKLKNQIESIIDNYDFIFIDCPPSLGTVTINALCASNTVIIPIQCEFYALEGLSQLINTIKVVKRHHNADLDLEGIVMTMYNPRLRLTSQVVDELKKNFNEKVYKTYIPRSVRIAEAPGFGKPAVCFDKLSLGSVAYMDLAREILGKNNIEVSR